ncbi:tetratricopeptide repeat protein, partial [Porphyromonas levii]
GVAYAKLGDTARAIDCFNKAIELGSSEAMANLKELSE